MGKSRSMRNVSSVFLGCGLFLVGCYKVQVAAAPGASGGEPKSATQNFFIGGLVGTANVDIRDFCGGSEAASVETSATFVNGLLSTLTFGIYSPRTVTVTCATGSAAGNSVTVYADSQGHPMHVTANIEGREVQGKLSATPSPDGVMAMIPVEEAN